MNLKSKISGVELNPLLVKQQKLNQTDIDNILQLYDERVELFEKFVFADILPKSFVQEMILELEDLEYLMQAHWNFKQDSNYHTWWCQIPGCTCNQLEQRDGQPKVFNETCKFHSK